MRSTCEISPGETAAAVNRPLAPEFGPDRPSLEEFAYRYGRSYDAYLAAEPGRECFFSREACGAVAYVRMGRYLKVGGGLLAAEHEREQLLAEFVAFTDRERLSPSFYNIAEADLPLFRKYGFQVTKWGEEGVIDLRLRSWSGKDFAWVRRQSNYCRRQGLTVSECLRDAMPAAEWEILMAELDEVSAALLAAKPQAAELRFLDGSFDPGRLGRQRIFIARRQLSGRVEGFLVCNPYLSGRGRAFEIYRHRPDAVRGTIGFLMHEAMQILQREGIEQVSLCLAPGLRASEPLAGDSALVRWGLTLGCRYFSLIFDAAGLYHFKSRFRPRFENRYLCARPKATLGSGWALVRALGVLRLDVRKLARLFCERLRKDAHRKTLAEPQGCSD
jgi:phosphatidylglycerol lysyltransferase